MTTKNSLSVINKVYSMTREEAALLSGFVAAAGVGLLIVGGVVYVVKVKGV